MQKGLFLLFLFFIILSFSYTDENRGLKLVIDKLGENNSVGKQYLLLIAINRYQNWFPLKNPVADAKGIRDILTSRYYIDNVTELYDEKATKANIIKTFNDLQKQLQIHDSLFIFYAGHGHLDDTTNSGFWIPVNAGTDTFEQLNWLPNTQIRGMVSKIKASHILLISDSCFSGDILDTTRAMAPTIDNEYFKKAYSRISRQVLTSGASETVPDVSEFACQLILVLERNMSTYLDPIMLFNQIRLGIKDTSPLLGSLKGTGHQDGASFLFFLRDAGCQENKQDTEKGNDYALYGTVETMDNSVFSSSSETIRVTAEDNKYILQGKVKSSYETGGWIGFTIKLPDNVKNYFKSDTDLLDARGIKFKAKSNIGEYLCQFRTTDIADSGFYQVIFYVNNEETEVKIMLDSLTQPQWAKPVPFDIRKIDSLSFTINSKPETDYDIILEISNIVVIME